MASRGNDATWMDRSLRTFVDHSAPLRASRRPALFGYDEFSGSFDRDSYTSPTAMRGEMAAQPQIRGQADPDPLYTAALENLGTRAD
jgi:hypothetical protein